MVLIALVRLWESVGFKPSRVIGHRLGEYSALEVAGFLSDRAAVFLFGVRVVLMTSMLTLRTHSMGAPGDLRTGICDAKTELLLLCNRDHLIS